MIPLKHIVNAHQREYFIEKVNEPLYKAVTILGSRFPEPTKENCLDPNSIRIIEILEKYNSYELNGRVKAVVNVGARILINKIEHSPNWRDRICFLVELLREGSWRNRALNHPEHEWTEPKPYGGTR